MRGFRSITSLPHSISQSEKLLPAIVISSHMEEKQSKYRLKRHFLCACFVEAERPRKTL